ncbi:MAG TPA: dihydroorotate dehydrogenase [Candidatus Saccharimonadales bacterium]|nr:dihydroorotate dehydrogenase [Candidatus Saccharimonadales bacterium]
MRAKRRVVTASGRPAGSSRTPPVRRTRPAFVPAQQRPRIESRTTALEEAAEPIALDLAVDIGRGLVLPNPILVASGTFGWGVEAVDLIEIDRLGGICTRGTTLKPRTGGATPRMAETPGGLLNGVGLQSPGIDAVIERYASTWAAWATPVIVNLAGTSVGEYVELTRRLEGAGGVAGIELNLSCPNAARGGILFGLDATGAGELVAAVRRATDLPMLVKLTPDAGDIRPIARAVADAGADALSAINTVAGLAVRADRRGPFLGTTYGGLSGPAIRPIALRVVYEVAQSVPIPVIGVGGIASLADVLDFLAVGAAAVQVGTAALADPGLPVRLVDELTDACTRSRLSSLRDLVGTALPTKPGPASTKGAEYRP